MTQKSEKRYRLWKGRNFSIQFKRMQWAMLLFGLMIVVLLMERRNITYEGAETRISILDNAGFSADDFPDKKTECLLLWDSRDANSVNARNEMESILSQMRISYAAQDMESDAILKTEGYEKIVLAVGNLGIFGEQIFDLFDYVKEGGNLMVAFPPETDEYFQLVSSMMGIQGNGDVRYQVEGLRFQENFMIGGEGKDFAIMDAYDSAIMATLFPECRVYLVSADDREVPLIWEYSLGKGKLVFNNLNYFGKAYRGFYAASYSLLSDVCVYPVINGSTFYIDDFPSPVPNGEGEYVKRDYNMDIKSFYTNVWWPDIQAMGKEHGVRYTGLVIEDYSDENQAPFEGNDDLQRFRYFGNKLLDDGGEIGFHGYNHMPLVLDNFDYKGEFDTYKQWKSPEDIALSLKELNRFCTWLFPKEKFQVYVPPSNILSKEGRALLGQEIVPVKAIASIYFPGEFEYSQDFQVAEDGIIETPRVISGYMINSFMEIAALSELNFHFVNSHFQHPDDVLDVDRGAELGWPKLKASLKEYMDWLYAAAPGIRNLTGSEMAAAVQRYYFLDTKVSKQKSEIKISLSNFKDEAWLMVRINKGKPGEVSGGTLTEAADGLYLLKAQQDEVVIRLK